MAKSLFSPIENSQPASIIEQVYEGMTVIDQDGKKLGKVEVVKMGDPQALTTQGEELEQDDSLVEQMAISIFGSDMDFPKSVRDNLLIGGFIKIHGGNFLHRDRYIPADEIASVSNDTVTLLVTKNQSAPEIATIAKPKKESLTPRLIKAKTLRGYKLDSLAGEIGKVEEFYFDDWHWAVRYLVADTGDWLTGRKVLISPYVLVAVNKEEQLLSINLTKKQIEESPSLDSHKPVSRQFEASYVKYYGMPMYWSGSYIGGYYPFIERDRDKWNKSNQAQQKSDPDLRSTRDVSGQHILAADGEIGHVEDFIIDDETWAIRYLIIATRNWWPGKKVLISPQWIDRASWNESKLFIGFPRETIKQSPEYSEESVITRQYETLLHRHYNRQGYWED